MYNTSVQAGKEGWSMEQLSSSLVTLYSDVKATTVNWLWYPYIPIGKITIVAG